MLKKSLVLQGLIVVFFLVLALSASPASAQTTTSTPGVPSTGAAGNALQNIIIILASILVAGAGLVYLAQLRTKEIKLK